jgi:NADH-quinone oxidoreductase subunit J|uniref:NADH dehydrogenase subunit 6 n=1 Tax=Cryptomonas pyrenoidifera TaxID=233184 RepID=UPI00226CDA29|nr:NADH dehydrogenase subunit 6 [Cryptomonas pyrenoidifera]UZP15152.1 NADH dehydrogenase subunit 6 [Cryptomonas pyrenoidifera]
MENLFFYFFSILSIIFSFFVIISKNPVHSILSLILVFFNAAALLILLGAEFLAMLFIIVYVGAVAVLFLFVIMMLNIKTSNLSISMYRYLPISILFGSVFFSELFVIFYFDLVPIDVYNLSLFLNFDYLYFNDWENSVSSQNNVLALGLVLYTYFSYLFVVSGIILLVSMIGAISLTLHRRNDIKRQYIYKQLGRNFKSAISWKY